MSRSRSEGSIRVALVFRGVLGVYPAGRRRGRVYVVGTGVDPPVFLRYNSCPQVAKDSYRLSSLGESSCPFPRPHMRPFFN